MDSTLVQKMLSFTLRKSLRTIRRYLMAMKRNYSKLSKVCHRVTHRNIEPVQKRILQRVRAKEEPKSSQATPHKLHVQQVRRQVHYCQLRPHMQYLEHRVRKAHIHFEWT